MLTSNHVLTFKMLLNTKNSGSVHAKSPLLLGPHLQASKILGKSVKKYFQIFGKSVKTQKKYWVNQSKEILGLSLKNIPL